MGSRRPTHHRLGRRPRRHWALWAGGGLAVLLGLAALSFWRQRPPHPSVEWPPIALTANDRLLILAPHPDDEILCCGGLLQTAQQQGVPIRIVFLTYGDNNEWSFALYRRHPVLRPLAVMQMGLVRHDEAVAAARLIGIPPSSLTFLGYPDFGTLRIWTSHWGQAPAFQSMLTHVTAVPYANARRPEAPYKGEQILQDLTEVIREFRPTKIFVSHPADHMPDHRALYLFMRVALWDLEPHLQPDVYPYLIHFKHWPRRRGYRPAEELQPPASLADHIVWQGNRLTVDQVERKHVAIAVHRTQFLASARYLLSFIRSNELFGDFPIIALSAPTSPIGLPTERGPDTPAPPEQLTDEERAAFVGVERRTMWLDGQDLVLTITLSRPLGRAVEASVFLFGYRHDRAFAQMPKLHVHFSQFHYAVYDQAYRLPDTSVHIERGARRLLIRVPLAVLGSPDKLLTEARTYLGDVPLDWAAWRALQLPAR